MFVAFSYLSVPFKTSERPATSSHYAIQSEHRQTAESRSAVCLLSQTQRNFSKQYGVTDRLSMCHSEEIKVAQLQGMHEDRVNFG